MKYVYQIKISERDQIKGKKYTKGIFFNPVVDGNGKTYISEQEVALAKKARYPWIKTLVRIPYVPLPWK